MLMNILFIQTGGSIDKNYPETTKAYAFEITRPASEKILARIKPKPNFSYKIVRLLQKDSLDLTEEDRAMIVNTCQKAEWDKIVVTHGTDTMLESAAALSVITDKTIVLTGAMTPERLKGSDADFNVGLAIGALEYLSNGVYIAMNGRVLHYSKSIRESSSGQFIEKKL
jgi:L-asparaginase